MSISMNYSCSSGVVTVTWGQVLGANSYRAEAVDVNGTALSCTSASNTCQITMLNCGERYLIQVTAISFDCQSTSNTSTYFETVPCAPSQLATYRECSSNVIIFSWAPTSNTKYYVATSLASNGQLVECRTKGTECFFTNTVCGHTYQFTVYAVSNCNSKTSSSKHVRTSPCIPQNIKTYAECRSDVLITTWDKTAGALSYTVEAQGNNGDSYNCSSFTNSCAMPGVACGDSLSVWITASDDDCTTEKELGEAAKTVPCSPTNVSASVECSPNSALMNWTVSQGAVFYIAMAQHTDGTVRSCHSMGSNCLIQGLNCGKTYTASVIATDMKCNSSQGQLVTIETGACPPTNVTTSLQCDGNMGTVSWTAVARVDMYLATATGDDGHTHTCSSNSTDCSFTDLHCAETYAVTVVTIVRGCHSDPSPDVELRTGACPPTNVTTSLQCDGNMGTVSWTAVARADMYLATATGDDGHTHTCSSNSTDCSFTDLHCAETYAVTVVTIVRGCHSDPSPDVELRTGACPPTNVTTSLQCDGNMGTVSWTAVARADMYLATATGDDGHTHTCSSNSTDCSFTDLHCAETYAVTVVTIVRGCHSDPSPDVELRTGACPPTNVTTSLQCDGNMGTVSWTAVAKADMYLATATGDDGHTHTCSSNSTDCSLTDLHCAETYAVTVVTIVRGCHSDPSPDVELRTGACPPTNVTTSLQCDGNMGTVSWTAVARADMYLATATGDDGHTHTCSSNSTDCSFTDLHCAETYAVTVVTIVRGCHSDPSPDVELRTGACPPTNVTTSLQCDGNMGTVSWTAVARADMYLATATGDDGHTHTCSSNSTDCSFTDLHCAETYAVTVVTIVRGCHSDPSPDVELRTGACPPTNVTTSLQCDGNMGTVSWTAVARADMYLATATGDDGHTHTCSSNSTDCSFTDLHCAETYAVTVVTIVRGCHSDPSPDVELRTGACPPHKCHNVSAV
ncbi:collagen alpha-1(VII) chain [Salmo salar]|uniref:Collagen alpha-1(VII) chain n=1 Tax=Salmo salar TaxID=8030 RepID=A0ABM3CST1_SALSA|nr:collagen alpha-1(VII) chain-like [Salmo salar]